MADDYVDLTFDKVAWVTENAVLFKFGAKEQWVPKSLIQEPDAFNLNDGPGEVGVQFWFVEKEGLEGFEA